MAKDKKSILVYADWISIFEKLEDAEAGVLIKHFFRYVNDMNPNAPDRLTDIIFEPIKQQLKRDLKRYEAICLRNRDNGGKGGRPKQNPNKPKKPSGLITNPNNPNEPDTDNDTDNDTEKEINILFDVFWNLYNKKVGDKKKCEKKWNSFNDEIREKIIDTLPAFILTIKDKQFQPFPQTYLNQERWNDEIIIPALFVPR
ncbi:MAG: DUF6291 domain-containing protein [Melioribacteraceae bacterium]|jgi:hypothetical protein|nr:DUF6291 domain-containing protein [Melioribacteraceae bacterium]